MQHCWNCYLRDSYLVYNVSDRFHTVASVVYITVYCTFPLLRNIGSSRVSTVSFLLLRAEPRVANPRHNVHAALAEFLLRRSQTLWAVQEPSRPQSMVVAQSSGLRFRNYQHRGRCLTRALHSYSGSTRR